MVSLKYPIYVISKGRWEKRPTSRMLDRLCIPYRIVIEPQEYEQYAAVIDHNKILVLPFSNLGQGSIPARNWVWEHSMLAGNARHWILDDNIYAIYRLNRGLRARITSQDVALEMLHKDELFTDRYSNVAMSGLQYLCFAVTESDKAQKRPFVLNTRVYSCILINNALPFRWRGRYNEDTDLSLRALKDGWCTILYYNLLIDKGTTLTMPGGNTDSLYQGDGRLKMAQSLQEQHPECVSIRYKWGRWQHHVDYSRFKCNKLRLANVKTEIGQASGQPEQANT